ncbi:hypothetical protein ACFX16_029141 [Malus domestica]
MGKQESSGEGEESSLPLFESTTAKFRGEAGRWAWIGMLIAEFWFSLYWIITQSVRWDVTYRRTFKDRLSHRFATPPS